MIITRKAVFSVILSGIAVSFAVPVFAGQADFTNTPQIEQSAPDHSLPGVKPAKPIVTPLQTEPENTAPSTNPDGSFNIGNTRVKISGDITVDVGTGNGPNRSNK